jgi:hypothetical protein
VGGHTRCGAEQLIREVRWSDLQEQGELEVGELAGAAAAEVGRALRVEHEAEAPARLELFAVSSPGIRQLQYAMLGQVRTTDVADGSYLEMWSHFADGEAFFTRTLGDVGPMQKLEGSSSWRRFSLPFRSSPETGVPSRLVVNLVLTGPGTVELSPLRLVEYADAEALQQAGHEGGWWNWRTGAVFGTAGGILLGIVGASIGILSGLGVAQRLVLGSLLSVYAAGCLASIAGLAAVVGGQPYHVFYPLLLLGIIAVAVAGPLLPVVRRRYAQRELRRIAALDVDAAGRIA